LVSTFKNQTIAVRLEDADPRRALLGLPPTGRLAASEVAHWQACMDSAWRLLVTRHAAAAGTLAAVVRVIVPVVADPGVRGISATSADAFGAVAMSTPADGAELAAGLLHETQHSLLNVTQRLFPLLTTPRTLVYSPWRDDPRPAIGLLHGAYAYLAVTRFRRTEFHAAGLDVETIAFGTVAAAGGTGAGGTGAGGTGAAVAFEFARWRAAVTGAAERLLAGDGLTPAGRRFVGALRDEVRPWLSEPVEPDVARLAAAANADHELRWRLRNHVADPAWVASAAAAWRDGCPAPPGPPPPLRLVPAPRRALENSARLELVREELARKEEEPARREPARRELAAKNHGDQPDAARGGGNQPSADGGGGQPSAAGGGGYQPLKPGSRATAGDVAFVRGEVVTAADAYSKDLHDDASWTGLVLATGDEALTTHLETVVAVTRALGNDAPEPTVLARWLRWGATGPK
jgi:hypothetical protein